MEVSSTLRNTRISPQKLRLIADQIRGLAIDQALNVLGFSLKAGAEDVKKVLESAMANAEHNHGADIDDLKIFKIFVNQGPTYKRMHARAKGRGARILKRTSHLTITLSDS